MSALLDWKEIDQTERDDLLIKFCGDGLTATQIEKRFINCTRSAVIGRIHRLQKTVPSLRLGGGTRPGPKSGEKKSKSETTHRKPSPRMAIIPGGAPKVNQYDFAARAEQRAASPGVQIRRENAFDPIPDSPPVAFALNKSGCRWPVDGIDGKGLMVCGAAKEPDHRNYCAAHARLACRDRLAS